MTPRSSASAKPTDGRGANSSFSISPQIRSAARSSSGIDRHRARVALVELEVESRGELHGAQHAQAVLGERGRIDGAEDAPGEVGAAVERVEVLVVERIPGDGVHREIATARGVGDRHGRIAGHVEPAVPAARFRFPAGQRDVDLADLDRPESSRRLPPRGRGFREGSGGDRPARPKTSMSMSLESRPSSLSRTHPPTISARPPACLTARAISIARSSVGDSLVIGDVATAERATYLITWPERAVAARRFASSFELIADRQVAEGRAAPGSRASNRNVTKTQRDPARYAR